MPSLPFFASAGWTSKASMNDLLAAGKVVVSVIFAARVLGFSVSGVISFIHFEPILPSGNWTNSRMTRLPPQPRMGIQPAIRKRPPRFP